MLKAKFLLIGIGLGLLVSGFIVVFFSNEPEFSKWLLPFGMTLFTLGIMQKVK